MKTTNQNCILADENYVELVNVVDYIPVQSIYPPISKLMTIGVKKSPERFYFKHELERVVPFNVIRNYEVDYITYLVKETNLKS